MLEQEDNTTNRRFRVNKPTINIMVSTNIHEAIKAYAYSKNIRLREATEHLLMVGLYVEHTKKDKEE